jgi:hypothetical protein
MATEEEGTDMKKAKKNKPTVLKRGQWAIIFDKDNIELAVPHMSDNAQVPALGLLASALASRLVLDEEWATKLAVETVEWFEAKVPDE